MSGAGADLPGVAGDGPADWRRQALAAIEAIHDPCSVTIGTPIGLVGMGMVERLDIAADGRVAVLLLPTFPDCLFRTVFEEEIEKRLAALPWCGGVGVRFCPADRDWDESRMTPEARRRLGRRESATA